MSCFKSAGLALAGVCLVALALGSPVMAAGVPASAVVPPALPSISPAAPLIHVRRGQNLAIPVSCRWPKSQRVPAPILTLVPAMNAMGGGPAFGTAPITAPEAQAPSPNPSVSPFLPGAVLRSWGTGCRYTLSVRVPRKAFPGTYLLGISAQAGTRTVTGGFTSHRKHLVAETIHMVARVVSPVQVVVAGPVAQAALRLLPPTQVQTAQGTALVIRVRNPTRAEASLSHAVTVTVRSSPNGQTVLRARAEFAGSILPASTAQDPPLAWPAALPSGTYTATVSSPGLVPASATFAVGAPTPTPRAGKAAVTITQLIHPAPALWATPWPWAALALIPFVLAAAVLARRTRRTHRNRDRW